MGGVPNAPGPSPTLGSLGPSHQWRHKSRASLRGPPCAHGVAGTPQGEVRDSSIRIKACVTIVAKEVLGSARHKFYMEFDVVPVYSHDPGMLIKVSNALNIQVKDKVVTKNFRSQLKNARAKWIEKGQIRPKKAGAKHDPAFKVICLKHFTPP